MNYKFHICLLTVSLTHLSLAQPVVSTLDSGKKNRIHFRAGVSIRKISADFSGTLSSSSNVPTISQLLNRQSGTGDVGLFQGGLGKVTYDDGFAGGDFGLANGGLASGDAQTVINTAAQVSATNRIAFGLNQAIQEVAFSTSDFTYNSTLSPQSGSLTISDDQTTAGAFFQLVFPLKEKDDRFLNALIGYSIYNTSHQGGAIPLGTARINETERTHTYTYDYLGPANPNTSSFPFDGTGSGGLIYDAALQIITISDLQGGVLDPRQSTSSNSTPFNFTGISRASLNVELHEIPIGLEWGKKYGKTNIALNGGGTINIVDYDLYSRTDWYQAGNPNPVFSQMYHDSDTPVKGGAYLGLNFTRPLNKKGTVYLEGHASYRWVDTITARAGETSVEIDASSWEGGLGIGIILD